MEGSSTKEEERTFTFYVYHPCYFLEEASRALLRCLGIENDGTNMGSHKREEENPLLKPTSDSCACPTFTPEDSPNSSQISSQRAAADPPSKTSENLDASSWARRGSRRSGLSEGSGPVHN